MLPKVANLETCSNLNSGEYDGIVVVAPKIEDISNEKVRQPLESFSKVDESAAGGCFVVPSGLPSAKIVYSSTGPLNRDYDDVRRYVR